MRTEIIGNCTLILGDALEVLPTLEAGSVDAVVTDPPYTGLKGGVVHNYSGSLGPRRVRSVAVGDVWAANLAWLPEAERICTAGMVVFCGWKMIPDLMGKCGLKCLGIGSWYKRNSPLPVGCVPHYQCEHYAIFGKGKARWRMMKTHIDIPMCQAGPMAQERLVDGDGKAIHPTQKPAALMREVLSPFVSRILDPFMGTATTGVACLQLGLPFIGIEKEKAYFDVACKRIQASLDKEEPAMFEALNQAVLYPT